ncbi:tetratricopeptide repeat protein [Chamaesiphon sp. VAR_48_metabat_135_sub]|uniref:tetratricopeptide repeat protein n=1 Tax=Chamaesiphon sp. VAR_48_metabat_135_sub TaxID=2964699 RepID=UPI00286CC254|nr:tetratricopeptide repeat protein [Chamaesiphon sp. VAR_48_metabat_135_sub]
MTSADDGSNSNPNSQTQTLRSKYLQTIEEIVTRILTGRQIISKEYIYQILVEKIELGTSEIFEGCLSETVQGIEREIASQPDEVKQAKLKHKLNALAWIQTALSNVQDERQAVAAVNATIDRIVTAEPQERLNTLLQALDPNQERKFDRSQLQLMIKSLQSVATVTLQPADFEQLRQLSHGLDRGLNTLPALEPHLVSWIYESGQQIGFGGATENGPWSLWARQVTKPLIQSLFKTIGLQQSVSDLAAAQGSGDEGEWTELAIILQSIQTALVTWFDAQMYDRAWGQRMAFSTLITFAAIWCELANGIARATGINTNHRDAIAKACFQVTLQILRTAAQRPNFPLYGGIFAAFSGETLRDTLSYFDLPLKQVAGTQEKGRLLTILGYSQQTLGQIDRAIELHKEALEIANRAGDRPCEIANLNHLSRISIGQKDYPAAISYSQRALILARQTGDKLGEANALTNVGYSEVLSAHSIDLMDEDIYEQNISYLDRGLKLAETLEDKQSLALCYHSLGLAYLTIQQPEKAIEYLQQGTKAAQAVGDLYLQGLNLTYLAEAYHSLQKNGTAVFYSCLAMYQLHQIGAKEWRQSASLATVLQGQLGQEQFNEFLIKYRPNLLPAIGVDGYDYLPQLIAKYLDGGS